MTTPESQEKEDAAVLALVAKSLLSSVGDVSEVEIASVLSSAGELSVEGLAALENLGDLDFDSRKDAVSESIRLVLVSAMHRENTDAGLDDATQEALAAKRKEVLDGVQKRRQDLKS